MRVQRIQTQNILGLPDGSYGLGRRGTNSRDGATLIVGPRGGGKTSLLETIIYARESLGSAAMPRRPEAMLRYGETHGSIDATFILDPGEMRLCESDAELTVHIEVAEGAPPPNVSKPVREFFGRSSGAADESKLEYFARNRSLSAPGRRTDAAEERRLRPTKAAHKYAGLGPWLERVVTPGFDAGKLEACQRAIGRLVGGVKLDRAIHEHAPELLLSVRGHKTTLSRLSSAEEQAVLIACTVVRFGLESGLVLIDQPELHLHAAEQESFLEGLFALVPDAQVIIATGSSALLASLRRDQILTLVPSYPDVPAEPVRRIEMEVPPEPRIVITPPSSPAHSEAREAPRYTPSYMQPNQRSEPSQAQAIQRLQSAPAAPQLGSPLAPPPLAPNPPAGTLDRSTAYLGHAAVLDGPLPFERGAQAASMQPAPPQPGSQQQAVAPTASSPQAPASALLQSGYTVAGGSRRFSIPFKRGAAPDPSSLPPGWTLKRYAILCIDLGVSGLPEAQVLHHAQLSLDQRRALDDYFNTAMNANPELRLEWKTYADARHAELRGGAR